MIVTSTSSPARSVPSAQDVLGDIGIDVGAERLADPLALGEPRDHLVEAELELADLGRRRRPGRGRRSRRVCTFASARRTEPIGVGRRARRERSPRAARRRSRSRRARPSSMPSCVPRRRRVAGQRQDPDRDHAEHRQPGAERPREHARASRRRDGERARGRRSRARAPPPVRSIRSVSRYAHAAVTTPVIATTITTRTPSRAEYVKLSTPNSDAPRRATGHLERRTGAAARTARAGSRRASRALLGATCAAAAARRTEQRRPTGTAIAT